MLTRQQLEIINRKSLRYPSHIAEKEQEMGQIYYSKRVEDSQIETLIQSLPFDSITAV